MRGEGSLYSSEKGKNQVNFDKIELIGFKSFADKQEIKFDNGVTAIVGPNGCGKSNVADAIRWVLGEQSAKSLRGGNMQDVIFSGTQSRKSLSYCEVSLSFDNENKIFKDLDYSEVVFTRKLFRSGESEYYINKKPCRLKDIIDALHECGVSKEGYSVIGQGKVSEILSSKPEDRRAIFEEAVGIAKTKAQRLETERKLARTKDNIIRITDITTELERQLEPLEKQAEKARSFRALSEELKYHEVNSYLYKYENAAGAKNKINLRIKGFLEETSQRELELEEIQKAYIDHQQKISSADDYIRRLNDEILEKTVSFENKSGTAKLYNEKISYLRSEIKRLTDESNEASAKIKLIDESSVNKNEYLKKCAAEAEKLSSEVNGIGSELQRIIAEISEGEKKSQEAQKQIIASVESLADIKENIGALSSEKNSLAGRQKETEYKLNSLADKIAALNGENVSGLAKLSGLDKKIQQFKDEIKDKESDLISTNRFLDEINSKIYALNSQISATEASEKFYTNLKDSFDGYQYAVKKLLQTSKENRDIGSRVKGVVANIIQTEAKFDTAIETALGGALQNIVTATPEDAQFLIQYLKKTEGGRVTFLPVSSVKPRYETSDARRSLKERGALGLANELVSYDKYYQNIVSFLLGNTLITDTIENGVAIAKMYGFGFKIVTLDGDVLSTSGSMSGGSRKQNTSNLLAMDRKLEEIKIDLESKRAEMEKQTARKAQIDKQIVGLKADLESSNSELQETRQQYAALKEKLASTAEQIVESEKDAEGCKDSAALINSRLSEIGSEYSTVEEGNVNLIKKKQEASSDAEKHQSVFDALKKKRDELIEKNTAVQSRIAFLNAESKSAGQDISRMKDERAELTLDIENCSVKIAGDGEAVNKLLGEIEKVALSQAEQDYLSDLRSKRTGFEDKKKAFGEAVEKDNLESGRLRGEIEVLKQKKSDEDIALSKVDSELDFMQQRVWEEYQISYETALPLKDAEYDISAGSGEIKKLKNKIGTLGSINPNAIEDYNNLNERYQDMAAQKNDLEKAEADLKQVVTKLTDEMSATFETGFAAIRTNFSKTFKELFGGGSADLILDKSETEDPLEQGIEIVAEPPGKKLQKISLLSGGEMSLTAIAILFAILKLRPMPFCVLDEIEAALDDANVERFAKYLRRFSEETQFIVITHKKVTMELSDALYGVTMQEKGVSKIVSVKLSDIKEAV